RRAQGRYVSKGFVKRHDIGEPSLNVEQGPFVGDRRAIPDALADDDRAESVALRVRRRRADAGAGAAPGDQQRIDPMPDQIGGEVRAEERTGVLLLQDQVPGMGSDAPVDAAGAFVPGPEPWRSVGRGLEGLVATVRPPGARGIDDRQRPGTGRVEQAPGGLDRAVQPSGPSGVSLVGPSVSEIDDDEGRRAAKPEPVLEDTSRAIILLR